MTSASTIDLIVWSLTARRSDGVEPLMVRSIAKIASIRVAISNRRLVALDETSVTFRYKDYRREGAERHQTMTLAVDEFIRRFLLHVLPKGFHRIRHYGLLASTGRKANLAKARELLAVPAPSATAEPTKPPDHRPPCPCCGGRMTIIETFERGRQARAPPDTVNPTRTVTS